MLKNLAGVRNNELYWSCRWGILKKGSLGVVLWGIGIDSLFLLVPDYNTSFLCMLNSNGVDYNKQSGQQLEVNLIMVFDITTVTTGLEDPTMSARQGGGDSKVISALAWWFSE